MKEAPSIRGPEESALLPLGALLEADELRSMHDYIFTGGWETADHPTDEGTTTLGLAARLYEHAATLRAQRDALYEALAPLKRGAEEADYYCPDDVADDHTVLIGVSIAELRAAMAALAKASPPSNPQERP